MFRFGHAVCARSQTVWSADWQFSVDAGKNCGYVHDHECEPRLCVLCRPRLRPREQTTRFDAAGCILVASENATQLAGEAIQILGGNGYINEYPAGRLLLRDAKLYEIGAGTSEIRRMLIGRELFDATAA